MTSRSGRIRALIVLSMFASVVPLCILPPLCLAQDSSTSQSWTTSNQQDDPNGTINPVRTRTSHQQINGRTIDTTTVETLGPDGRYVLYSSTQKESVHVNDTTVRTTERTFGQGQDGEQTLIQEKQEESRSLPGGEESVVRTTSTPDADGAMQVVQREIEDSKQLSPGVRETNTTVLLPNIEGGLTPAVQTDLRETKNGDGTSEFKKSTLLSNGTGGWQLAEVRQGTTTQAGGQTSKDERVLRPDANGAMAVAERTVSQQTQSPGETRDTTETYSTNVPGQAGDNNLQLVRRDTTVRENTLAGGQNSTREIEQPNPADPSAGLRLTQEAIDIVRPGSNSIAQQDRTILTPGSDGLLHEVWLDLGKTDNPSVVHVDTAPPQNHGK
jgi:hypothetical protein